MTTIVDENWEVLVSAFPSGWQPLAREAGAIKHQLKEFRSESDLLRVLLMHVGKGYSLRETAVIAKAAGLADVSDVALLKRLRKSELWLLRLCQALLRETGICTPPIDTSLRLRLVDGSIIKEPGKTGSQWRLHFSFTLPEFCCDYFKISPSKGKGTGETFTHYPVQSGDYLMGDRAYSTAQGITYIASCDAYVLVRVNTQSLPLYDCKAKPFGLLNALTGLEQPFETREWPVVVKAPTGQPISGRLCALRKSEQAIQQTHKKLIANASKKQRQLQPETLEYAKYVMVFSTYPQAVFSTEELLEWYRIRWQVGVSDEGPVIQSVKVRPRQKDSRLVAGEVPWRESKAVKPSDKAHIGCAATHQVVTCSERRRSLVTRIPVAETVYNARRQQGPIEMSPIRRPSPAGYQRRHGGKEDVSTGEALAARRRKLVEEILPITVSGKG